MDEKIRLLIRKYQKTRDPIDAIKLAENLLRINAPVEIWVCSIFEGSDNGSDIYLFLTKAEAILKATDWLLEILFRDYSATERARFHYQALVEARKRNNIKRLGRLIEIINLRLPRSDDISIFSQKF